MTDAERKFWSRVRNRTLGGFKFVRQESIGPYYADFVCRDAGIVVEIDGGQHAESLRDRVRDAFLESAGYRVMRFWNNEVLANTDGVLEVLLGKLIESGTPHPDHSDE